MSSEINTYIQKQNTWNELPANIKLKLGDINVYNTSVLKYSLQNQLRFKSNLISKIFKSERRYYEKLMHFGRDNMLLYPYHLQDIIVGGLRLSAFSYYIDMLCHIMSQEKSYDFIPNFTAADILRLMGIGRNQYIELMNNLRGTNSILSNSNKSGSAASNVMKVGKRFLGIGSDQYGNQNTQNNKDTLAKIRLFLPSEIVEDLAIDPWWLVSVGVVLEPDISSCSPNLRAAIDHIIDSGPLHAGTINKAELFELYQKGMVYLDIPIEPYAIICVPTLEKFVMNRTSGDQFEVLLYKIFVALDENSTVDGLADILQIPLEMVQQAVSVFCRLQFAQKKPNPLDPTISIHSTWGTNANTQQQDSTNQSTPNIDFQNFLLDESQTGLDESSGSMTQAPSEYESCEIKTSNSMFLTPSPSMEDYSGRSSATTLANDELSQSMTKRRKIAFVFDSSLTAYLMMGNLSAGLKNHAVTMFEVGKLSEESLDQFLKELDSICDVGEGEAQRYYEHAVNLRFTIRKLRSISSTQQQHTGLDLLRYGSLLSLDTASRSRMLAHNYRCLVTMAPLCCYAPGIEAESTNPNYEDNSNQNSSNIIGQDVVQSSYIAPLSIHPNLPMVGPVIPQMTSVWFRLYTLYKCKIGPPSLLLVGGWRIRVLPDCLTQFSRLLITPWQQESIIISSNIALVTINDALTHGPILVQGYDKPECKVTEKQIPFPLDLNDDEFKNESLLSLVKQVENAFDLQNKCGYISYLVEDDDDNDDDDDDDTDENGENSDGRDDIELGDTEVEDLETRETVLLQIHFGVPLFDDKLNEKVLNKLEQLPIFKLSDSISSINKTTFSTDSSEYSQPIESTQDNKEGDCVYEYEKSMVQLSYELIRFMYEFSTNENSESVYNLPKEPIKSLEELIPFSRDLIRPRVCLLFNNGHLDYYPNYSSTTDLLKS